MDFVYIGVLIGALAFALVVIYASLVLKRAADTMESLSETLGEVEQKLHHITPELRKTVDETGKTVDDLQDKLAAADNLFGTLENLGTSVHEGSRFLNKQTENASSFTSPKYRTRMTETIKWFDVVYKLYKKVK
ncbi:Uncharacterized protein YoxC, contains an MCP-like domain [Lentibacillus halodurans]|uniref:Uncharacterized protein YoxC, contains an MCP-like domain n=1 Tax=Lentibacillus halodurans TaxID=237679 RepID=A0A1I1AMK7_9BACI|nr:DUF948 domain-containing protein [Lentibacillus halodurans]SFB37553.1 Uncharacterized protein YoxC, contains an MCP-like domain [Lentibacillus halodurans]